MNPQTKKLYRSKSDRIIAGICGGLAEYFEIDPVLVRIIFAILLFAVDGFFIVYIIGWFIIPNESDLKSKKNTSTREHVERTSEEIQSQAQNLLQSAKGLFSDNTKAKSNMTIGIILIALGFFFFLNEFVPQLLDFGKLWPIFVIAAGLYIILKQD